MITTIAAVSARPIRPAPHRCIVVSSGWFAATPPIIQSVMNQKPIAEMPPATISPR